MLIKATIEDLKYISLLEKIALEKYRKAKSFKRHIMIDKISNLLEL